MLSHYSVLFQIPVDIDAKDQDGWTPLMAAAHWGQEEACKVLVENFANMEEKNLSVGIFFRKCCIVTVVNWSL